MKEEQTTLFQDNAEYDAFVEKFKHKKTTDDCYTPANIYDAVADWVAEEYGIDRKCFLRPFKPGGDYEHEEYPDGYVVVDNPPFSILTQIVKFYNLRGVPFFLFCSAMTPPKEDNITIIATGNPITYDNGADINTSFVTNLQPDIVLRSAPTLYKAVNVENRKNTLVKRLVPQYTYPDHVITSPIAQRYSHYGVEYAVRRTDAKAIAALDQQHAEGKKIFGHGYLLSERAAAERAAAERAAAERVASFNWQLSEREKEIVKSLGQGGGR